MFVLLHGLGMGVQDLSPLARALMLSGASVSLVLLKGHGDEEAVHFAAAYDDWLGQIEAVCAPFYAAGRPVVLVGYSLGATLALDHAADWPVDAVVGISTFLATRRLFLPHVILPLAERAGIRRIARTPLTTTFQTHKKLSYHRYMSLKQLREAMLRARRVRYRGISSELRALFLHSSFDPLASHNVLLAYADKLKVPAHVELVRELSHFLQFDIPPEIMVKLIRCFIGLSSKQDPEAQRRFDEARTTWHASVRHDCTPFVSVAELCTLFGAIQQNKQVEVTGA